MQVTGLSPASVYYFVVQSRTYPSAFNPNIVDSEMSDEIIGMTTANAAIDLLSPDGGEELEINTVQEIKWTTYGLSGNLKIEYSTDNGVSWKIIALSTPNDGSYLWQIPYDASTQCKIRLGYEGTPFIDTSQDVFSIVIPDMLIVVTSPNGGETLYAGDTVDLQWISL